MTNKSKDETTNMENKIEKLIKQLLADHLGIDVDEIANEDSFIDNLGMGAADLSDFFELLSKKGLDTENLDFPELETVADLIENLSSEEII